MRVGDRKEFFLTLKFPQTILGNSAIGNIISRNYFIELIGDIGLFSKSLALPKHVIINNKFAA